jgi:type III secretion protein T
MPSMTPFAMAPASLLLSLALAGVRTGVALGLVPVFGSGALPPIVIPGLTVAVSLPVAFAQPASAWPAGAPALAALLGKEAMLGGVIALGFGTFWAGLQTAGELIDHQTGLTFSQAVDPLHGNAVSPTSQCLQRLLFAVVLLCGGLQGLLDALYLSFEAWPPGAPWPRLQGAFPSAGLIGAERLFALSLLLAAPVLVVLSLVDAALGLLNRAAPGLGVHTLGLSLKPMVGLGVLVMALPSMVQRTVQAAAEVAREAQQLLLSWA